ncbi:unnamed protein product [Lactuca virosa]|uniref:Terpene synthase metal-binding domain-containing protein n=1 Tax=Lactuca virosa TaxID=75947 RepID=A0AAU9NKZ9_9ASTR|nr:unnamed protein product [Lactuca virosa]
MEEDYRRWCSRDRQWQGTYSEEKNRQPQAAQEGRIRRIKVVGWRHYSRFQVAPPLLVLLLAMRLVGDRQGLHSFDLWPALYFEPQYSDARIFLMKTCNLAIILDDTYDNYGTYEELEMFTQAVQIWLASYIDTLPEYMKFIYQELLDVYKEAEEVL